MISGVTKCTLLFAFFFLKRSCFNLCLTEMIASHSGYEAPEMVFRVQIFIVNILILHRYLYLSTLCNPLYIITLCIVLIECVC